MVASAEDSGLAWKRPVSAAARATVLPGLAGEVEFAAGVGGFGRGRAASAAALGRGAGEDDEQDAGELGGRGLLVQHEQAEQDADGGFEGDHGAEHDWQQTDPPCSR